MCIYILLKSGEEIKIEGSDLLEKVNELKNENGWIFIDEYMIREENISYIRVRERL